MLKDKNGNQVGVYCENTGDKDAKVSDCTLTGFYITSRDGEALLILHFREMSALA